MKKLTHIDDNNRPIMVDVGTKLDSHRIARAEGFIYLKKATLKLVCENKIKKGNVVSISEIAGIFGAKKTSELIPLCHTILINKIDVKTTIKRNGIKVESEVSSTGKTGVEMEALIAVNIALLTIYDMCKAVDKNMRISKIRLIEKRKIQI